MNILRRHRSLKYLTGVVVATVPAIAYFRYQNYNTDHLLLTLAPLRFGRAALTGASIVIDYKISLSGLSNDSQEYKEALSKVDFKTQFGQFFLFFGLFLKSIFILQYRLTQGQLSA